MNLPTGVLTGYIAPDELRDEFDREDCGSLDASEFVAAGSIARQVFGTSVCTLAFRHSIDAYDYTDRTAVSTDCASVPK
jgi:hypothetical protein